jgi:type I restriction enzyme, S subunit
MVGVKELKSIRLPLPPLAEQKEIVKKVEALFAYADQLEEAYERAKESIDQLPQSILAKAFRGELVPQDPNDEPASVLLERIKEERAKPKAKKEKKGKTGQMSFA